MNVIKYVQRSSRLPVSGQVSPGAPHRGGGLPISEPGLNADALNLGKNLAESFHFAKNFGTNWLECGAMARANTLIVLDVHDNIAIALQELSIGTIINQDDISAPLEVKTAIPRGHKIALTDIEKGSAIIKYGERMGHAYHAIPRGAHVHTHNVIGDRVSTEPTS